MIHGGARTAYGSPMPGSPRSRSFALEDPIVVRASPQEKDGFGRTQPIGRLSNMQNNGFKSANLMNVRKSVMPETSHSPSHAIEREDYNKEGRKTTLGQHDEVVHGGGLEENTIDQMPPTGMMHKRTATDLSGKDISKLKLISDIYKQGSSVTRQSQEGGHTPLFSPLGGRTKFFSALQNQNRFRKHKPGDPFQYVFSNVHMLMGHAGASI